MRKWILLLFTLGGFLSFLIPVYASTTDLDLPQPNKIQIPSSIIAKANKILAAISNTIHINKTMTTSNTSNVATTLNTTSTNNTAITPKTTHSSNVMTTPSTPHPSNATTTPNTPHPSNVATTHNAVAHTIHVVPINTAATEEKIKQFLQQESSAISTTFPYRMNLYKSGQRDKNTAGIRIAETAKQLFGDTAGLLFLYQLYNHSMRVPHWHSNATEVGSVLSGKMRVTIWQGSGEAKVFTVEKNGTWMIPQAALHSLENIGSGPLTFFVAYNSPNAADRDFATAWSALPNAILERSLGLNAQEIDTIKKTTVNRLSSFDPSAAPLKADISNPFSGNFTTVRPIYNSHYGSIKRVDQTTNLSIQAMALQQTILKPGTLRVPHWYTGADVLLFVFRGEGFFTLMDSIGKVYNVMIKPGDLIFIPVGTFHSYLNTGKQDLLIYEVFNAAKGISEITILNGAQHFSVGSLEGATGISKEAAQRIINNKQQDYIIPF